MPELRSCRSFLRRMLRISAGLGFLLLYALSIAHAQVLYQDQLAQVDHLPSLAARTHDPSDVLLTSLHTIIRDDAICCDRDSALQDSAQAADPKSLKDVASKLEGRHLLADGRPIKVTTEFLTPDAVNSGHLIQMILDQHPPLMEWNSHVYVVHGVVYAWTASGSEDSTAVYTVIRKFLLWDTRYADSRRDVVFDRATDDPNKVQGLLFVLTAAQ